VPAISNILTGRMHDLLLARATFAAAVKRWPGVKLTLRNGRAHHRENLAGGQLSDRLATMWTRGGH
jgi:hypothetical protein